MMILLLICVAFIGLMLFLLAIHLLSAEFVLEALKLFLIFVGVVLFFAFFGWWAIGIIVAYLLLWMAYYAIVFFTVMFKKVCANIFVFTRKLPILSNLAMILEDKIFPIFKSISYDEGYIARILLRFSVYSVMSVAVGVVIVTLIRRLLA